MNLSHFLKPILPLLFSLAAVSGLHANTYYVSVTSGSDSNNGTSLATPFQTIQKAANMMLSSGDICNIRTGLYRETVTVKASNVTFQAYNPTPATPSTAEPVTITGTELIPAANWVVDSTGTSGTTWSVAVPSGNGTVTVDQTQVFQGTLQTSGSQTGMVMKPEACWPNPGPTYPWHDSSLAHPSPYNQVGDWSYVDTVGTSGSFATFTDAQLPSSFSSFLPGAMIYIMAGQGWRVPSPTPTVTSFNGTTVVTTYTDIAGDEGTMTAGNEYFIIGKKELMDSQGEWFCAGSGTTPSTLYYLGSSTQPQNIEVKRRLYGFDLSGFSSITLTGLNFFGCTINTNSSSTSCNFNWLVMKYVQHSRQLLTGNVYALTLYNNSTLRNSELSWASCAILSLAGSNIKVINNYIHDSGYLPQEASMVVVFGNGALISHNTLKNASYGDMGSIGSAAVIEYNNMSNAMTMCSDGGIFASSRDGGNTVFRYNLLHDSPGPVGHAGNGVVGFYLDNQNSNWVVHHNIIWNLTGSQSHTMQINGRTNTDMIFNNTCWNSSGGTFYTAAYTDGPTGNKLYNNIFKGGPTGVADTLSKMDFSNNYNSSIDPGFVNAAAGNFQLSSTAANIINKGTPVSGVTDVAPMISSTTPDIGALQYGGTNWATTTGSNCVGCNFTTPPSPDPVYAAPFIPYQNMVQDPSFASGSLASYTTTGNLGLIYSFAWNDPHLRTDYYGLQFGGGTSTVSQTVTGLQSNSRYVFQCGVLKTDTTATVTMGVISVPYPNWEVTVLPSGTATSLWYNILPTVPTMYALPFVTGPSSTQATVYVKITRDAGVQVVSASPPALTTTAPAITYLSWGSPSASNYYGSAYPATGVYMGDPSVTLSSTAPTPILSVTPSSAFASSGQVGGPFTVTTGTFSVANIGNVPISWAVSNTSSWLTISSTGGTLLAAGSTTVTATIVAGATGFASGTYRDTLTFTNTYNGAGNVSIPCTLNIAVPSPVLSVTPATPFETTGPAGGPFTPASTGYTIANTGNLPMNWTVSNTTSWMTVSPSSGTLAAHGSITVTATTTLNANSLITGIYSDSLVFTNISNGTGNTSLACTLTIGADYFTQLFDTGSNNTAYHSFTFTPSGTGGYSKANCDATTVFPTDPTGGTPLTEGDDTYVAVNLLQGASVPFYGTAYTSFYVGSNGYITFGVGDNQWTPSIDTHFSKPRISGLFRDMNLLFSGTVSWKQLTDRVAVTYQDVPAYYPDTDHNNFQIEMFFDGRIRITILSIDSTDGLIGLSQGLGTPLNYTDSIFTAYPATPLSLVVTTPDYTTTTLPSVTLQGSASGANDISSVVVNGTTATTSDSFAHWSATVSGLSLGINTISVTATDGVVPADTISATRRVLYYTSSSSLFGNGLPDAWKIAHGLDPFNNTGVNSAIGNPSGDGISNLMKYALNLDPQLKQAGKLPYTTKAVNIADSKTYLIFNYRRIIGGGGLTYIVETSTNLTGWSSTNSDLEEISATPDADGVTQDVQVRVHPSISMLPAGSKFIRLRVTSP